MTVSRVMPAGSGVTVVKKVFFDMLVGCWVEIVWCCWYQNDGLYVDLNIGVCWSRKERKEKQQVAVSTKEMRADINISWVGS